MASGVGTEEGLGPHSCRADCPVCRSAVIVAPLPVEITLGTGWRTYPDECEGWKREARRSSHICRADRELGNTYRRGKASAAISRLDFAGGGFAKRCGLADDAERGGRQVRGVCGVTFTSYSKKFDR